MAAITQKITNFLGGVSTQPDTKKLPGQLREAKKKARVEANADATNRRNGNKANPYNDHAMEVDGLDEEEEKDESVNEGISTLDAKASGSLGEDEMSISEQVDGGGGV